MTTRLAPALLALLAFVPGDGPPAAAITVNPDLVLSECLGDPSRVRTIEGAWRAYVDPRTGFASDSSALANARRLLSASARLDGGTTDWPRLLRLVAGVESGLGESSRTGWARVVLPMIPERVESNAGPDARAALGRLRKAWPAGEAFARVAVGVGRLAAPKADLVGSKAPAEVRFLAWIAALTYGDHDLPVPSASSVHASALPLLWEVAGGADEAPVREMVLTVNRLLRDADGLAKASWRDWSVPPLLQKGRGRPALVGAVDAEWEPLVPLVTEWLEAKGATRSFGWTPHRGQDGRRDPNQTGMLRLDDALFQPEGTQVAGDHPLVLHLLAGPLRSALKGEAGTDSDAARLFLRWLAFDRALAAPEKAAASCGLLLRVFDVSPDLFAVDPSRGRWAGEASGDGLFVRQGYEGVVARFDDGPGQRPWLRAFVPAFRDNPALAGSGVEGLRAAGRVRLLGAWDRLAAAAGARAERIRRASVPDVSLEEALARLSEGDRKEFESCAAALMPARDDARVARVAVKNPWCEAWLLAIPGDRRLTTEEQSRWRSWCREMSVESAEFAVDRVWPGQVADSIGRDWTQGDAFTASGVLGELPWDEPAFRKLLNRSIAEVVGWVASRPGTAPTDRVIASAAMACRVGVPDDESGRAFVKAIGENGRHRPIAACQLSLFATAYRPASLRPAGSTFAVASPNLTQDDLAEIIARLSGGDGAESRRSEFEIGAVAQALHALVGLGGEELELRFPASDPGGLRSRVNQALAPISGLLMARPELIPGRLGLLTDAARFSGWRGPTGPGLAAAICGPGGDLGFAPPESLGAAVDALGQLRAEVLTNFRLSIAEVKVDPVAYRLLRTLRRHVGGLCASLDDGEASVIPLLHRADVRGPLRALPATSREPWWDLGGWYRLSYHNGPDGRPARSPWRERFPEVARLVRDSADAERGLFPPIPDPYEAEGQPARSRRDLDGIPKLAPPSRPFDVARQALEDRITELTRLDTQMQAAEAQRRTEKKLEEVRDSIRDGIRFDMAASRDRFESAVQALRVAENHLDARRHAELAAEAEAAGAVLFAQAATLKAKQAEFEVALRINDRKIGVIEDNINEVLVGIADGSIPIAEGWVEFDELELKKVTIRRESIAKAIAVLRNEIALVKSALYSDVPVTNQETGEKVLCQGTGQIGALAKQAEWQVLKYQDRLHKTQDEYRDRLKKLREGDCIKAITRVIGSLVCLIPGAGPFIGMGIIAVGELAAGIHTGKSIGDITVGLIDNALDIAKQAGLDIEKEINELGAKAGTEVDKLLGEIDERLGPLLKQLPTFLDKDVLRVALDATDLKGPARDLLTGLGGVLQAARDDTDKFGKLGTLMVAVGRNAAVRGQTPQELLDNLKTKLVQEFESGKLKAKIDAMADDVRVLGRRVDEVKKDPAKFAPALADQLARLVLAESGRGMVEHRDRLLSALSIGICTLQAKLGTVTKKYDDLKAFVEGEFASEFAANPQLRTVLDQLLGLLPEDQKRLLVDAEGHYKRLDWDRALGKVAADYLSQLLPSDPDARALYLGKLKLHADPTYASERLGLIVRPWQASLQARLGEVQDVLNEQVAGGDEKQQLEASIAHIDKGIAKLNTDVLPWLKNRDSDERRELKEKLEKLEHDLDNKENDLSIERLNGRQAEIRIEMAKAEVVIARSQAEIARMTLQAGKRNLDNADIRVQHAELEKQVRDLEGGALEQVKKKTAEKFLEKWAEYLASEAEVDKAKREVRGRQVELEMALEWGARVKPPLPPVDGRILGLQVLYDRELDAACASARELFRLIQWVGMPVPGHPMPAHDRLGQIKALKASAEDVDRSWDLQDFRHDWIQEIDLDGRTAAGAEQIRQLFSSTGTVLRIVPGTTSAGAVSLGRGGIIKEHAYFPNARIVAAVLIAGRYVDRPQGPKGPGQPRCTVIPQGGWVRDFNWLGTEYEWSENEVRARAYPNRMSVRSTEMLSGLPENYLPFHDAPRPPGWELIPSGGEEAGALIGAGFTPSAEDRPGSNGLPSFLRLTDPLYLQALTNLNRQILEHFRVADGTGMRGIARTRAFRRWLGPPLYGEHMLRVAAGRGAFELAGDRPIIDHVRICILYFYKAPPAGERP